MVLAPVLLAAVGLGLMFWADHRWQTWGEAEQRTWWPAMACLRVVSALLLLWAVVWFTVEMFIRLLR